MVINDLFSDVAAKNINRTASVMFGNHLFIFCEYEPGDLCPINPDGQYVVGALNLYKMFIDSSVGVQLVKLNKSALEFNDSKRWDKCIEDIGLIRTNYSHNIGDNQDAKRKYTNWLRNIIKKDQLETIEDYSKALSALVDIQTDCCDILTRFVQSSNGQLRGVARINFIEKWEQHIIHYYSKNDYNVFIGQIRTAMINKGVHPDKVTKLVVAAWFQDYYEYKLQSSIKNLNYLIKTASLPVNSLRAIQDKIEEKQSEMDNLRSTIARSLKKEEDEDLRAYDYQKYYCKNLEVRLQQLLRDLKKNSFSDTEERLSNVTMVPSSMLQLLIKKDFKDIPISK